MIVVLVLVVGVTLTFSLMFPELSADERVVEHVQLILLALGAGALVPAVLSRGHGAAATGQVFCAALLFGAFCAGLGRETGFGKVYDLDHQQVLAIKGALAVMIFFPLAGHGIRALRHVSGLQMSWRGEQVRLFLWALGAFAVSDLFEKEITGFLFFLFVSQIWVAYPA